MGIIEEISGSLSQMYANKDVALFESLCTDDFTVWHNFDQIVLTRDEVFEAFTRMIERYDALQMEIGRVDPLVDGFVQQHVVKGSNPDGSPAPDRPACVYVFLRNDKIWRIEEYIDVSDLAELRGG